MFMQDYNNENTATLSKEVSVLNLPGYKGVKKSSRIPIAPVEDAPVEYMPPQLIIKCDDLTAEQETALIAVINDHPVNEAVRVADYEANHKYKDDRKKAYAPLEQQLEMIYKDKKYGTNTFVEHNDHVRETIPKPESV